VNLLLWFGRSVSTLSRESKKGLPKAGNSVISRFTQASQI
jgi:hypothetical protein